GKASKTDDITSITKQEWPKPGSEYNDDVEKVVILSNIIKEIRQHKARNKLPQNAELEKVSISLEKPLGDELEEELRQISKIKEIEIKTGKFNITVE
ncbi:hypothetical protein KKG55_00300, partial [Candidatus Micrarchaeota archaeon]|nr:hypothetical protein [Candidatus Micrarchaeota archaeon]MBU1886146.1 hypothetical protein [Candidatus Micrarchaeota archaeon]